MLQTTETHTNSQFLHGSTVVAIHLVIGDHRMICRQTRLDDRICTNTARRHTITRNSNSSCSVKRLQEFYKWQGIITASLITIPYNKIKIPTLQQLCSYDSMAP